MERAHGVLQEEEVRGMKADPARANPPLHDEPDGAVDVYDASGVPYAKTGGGTTVPSITTTSLARRATSGELVSLFVLPPSPRTVVRVVARGVGRRREPLVQFRRQNPNTENMLSTTNKMITMNVPVDKPPLEKHEGPTFCDSMHVVVVPHH
jgi:hypothetical protein